MADRDLLANNKREALRIGGRFMRNVQNTAVLHIGSGTDPDLIHVTPDRNKRPDADVILHNHITDDNTA